MRVPFLVLLVIVAVNADMYLHNPRGSNNRLDEANRERNNANRLFDSQNNNRGGYNVGSLYYYTGSVLSVEWTNQHSCADANNHCEIIFQYMCADNIRDGATTSTIPDRLLLCENFNCNEDIEYGMHETFDYYITCRLRERNMGLFTADQNVRGSTAIYTRQNPGGTRRGYECPEERDYYPYWHYSPWIDVAVLTNDATRCPYYEMESTNVKSRWGCIVDNADINRNLNNRNRVVIPNNEVDCYGINGTWFEFQPNGQPAPQCMETLYSRDNHLGNGLGGFPNTFNWTIPNTPHEHCVFRARYNISTQDYEAWNGEVTSANNTRGRDNEANLDVFSEFGFNSTQAVERGYLFENNPEVKIFDNADFRLRLAIDTSQFGRTFQDRSHSFAIRARPSDIPEDANIFDLNVRGKRGNIVQTYPGVEYDFVPNRLTVSIGDYLHIQWTGSNTNPNNNDGQGRAGTDRSNIVMLRDQNYPEGTPGKAVPLGSKFGHFGNSYPAHLDNSSFLGLPRRIRQNIAVLDNLQFGGEMSELDDAGTYFDIGAWKITSVGTYYFLCTRNNNFSNRSQKGKIIVVEQAVATERIGWNGGEVRVVDHMITVERGAFSEPTMFTMQQWPNTIADGVVNELAGRSVNLPDDSRVSDVVTVSMEGGRQVQPFTISMKVDDTSDTKIVRYNALNGWNGQELESQVSGDMVSAQSDQDGVFVASSSPNQYVLIGAVVGSIVVVLLIFGAIILFFVIRRDKWQQFKQSVKSTKTGITRSFASKV